jgi:N-formylglutamate deformylase
VPNASSAKHYPSVVIPGVLTAFAPAPAAPALPLIFDSPHSGTQIPTIFDAAVAPSLVLMSTDTHVETLFGSVPGVGASLLRAEFPRSFIDVNRAEADIDPLLLNAPWPGPLSNAPSVQRGMGLIWRLAWGDQPMYARKLGIAEIEARLNDYYRPYHTTLDKLLDDAYARWGQVWYVDCHSMPAAGHALSPDPPGSARADVVLGDRDGTTCTPELLSLCAEHFQAHGYSVRVNDPFKGGELVRRHGQPSMRRHALQIELNRRLYMNEQTRAVTEGYEPLRAACGKLAEGLAQFIMARL